MTVDQNAPEESEPTPRMPSTGHAEAATMSTAMLKAMAHPLRQRILQLLRQRRHLRAADAAAELAEPANKVSFHLRVLADAGLIEEAPEKARDGRDRVWKVSEGSWSLGNAEHPVPDEALGDAVIQALVAEHYDLVRRVAAWAREYTTGRETHVHGTFTRSSTHLTEAEFVELMAVIQKAISDAEDAHDENAPGTRAFDIDIIAADDTL